MSTPPEPPPGQAALRPPPTDLPAFLPFACKQLGAPFTVKVIKRVQDVYVSKIDTSTKKNNKSKISLVRSMTGQPTVPDESSSEEREPPATDGSELAVTAVLDAAERLVELQLQRRAPRLLLQVLALCLPYQAHLAKLAVRRVQLDGASLYEIGKMLPASYLTELCLDDSPVPQRNYGALLDAPAQLRHLSLDRCDIDDEDCAALAEGLAHPRPASRRLAALSLASNAIGDPGACAVGRALRSNRALLHLNLAGNRITDDGAAGILASLDEFALTPEESVSTRRRRLDYLKLKRKAYAEFYAELSSAAAEDVARGGRRRVAPRAGRKSSGTSLPAGAGGGPRCSWGETVAARAEAMALELVGAYRDPFGGAEVRRRGGRAWCAGNTALCSLGLAYNALGHETLVRLRRVLLHQRARAEGAGGGGGAGLLRVALEGNPLPWGAGGEAQRVGELLRDAAERLAGARLARGRDKTVMNKLKVTLPK